MNKFDVRFIVKGREKETFYSNIPHKIKYSKESKMCRGLLGELMSSTGCEDSQRPKMAHHPEQTQEKV